MKQFFSKQLTNIVFLVLIVAAALAIYLLSRAESAPQAVADAVATPAASSPSPSASASPKSRGIPEAVLKSHLQTSEQYYARSSAAGPHIWILTRGKSPEIRSTLLYELENDGVSSLELSFELPKATVEKVTPSPTPKAKGEKAKSTPKPNAKQQQAKNTLEQHLKDGAKEKAEAQENAIRVLLSDLFPVCDGQERLSASTVRYWAEQALALKKSGDKFEETVEDCRFQAYVTEQDDETRLVCCLYFK